jgi:hypothetical protein
MVFAKQIRDGVKRGRIKSSVRIWQSPRVKIGNKYPLDDGHIVVDSIEQITRKQITYDLAREGGFESVEALLATAKHGKGRNIYLVRFHYLPAGAWNFKGSHRIS